MSEYGFCNECGRELNYPCTPRKQDRWPGRELMVLCVGCSPAGHRTDREVPTYRPTGWKGNRPGMTGRRR